MSTATLAIMRRIATIAGLLGVFIIVVGAFLIPHGDYIVSAIGALLGLISWLVAVYIGIGASRLGWLVLQAYLALVAVVLAVLSIFALKFTDERLGAIFIMTFATLAVGGFIAGVVPSEEVIARPVSAALGGAAFVVMIVGGTIIGDSVGAPLATAALQNAIGDHMYLVAGILGLAAWIIGIATAVRIKAWGWFIFAILLPGIGAFMFGLFGPSAQDVRQARENAAARRAAGVRG